MGIEPTTYALPRRCATSYATSAKLESLEGFEPSTLTFVASRSNPIGATGTYLAPRRGVEPLCPWPSRAASTGIASDWISPQGRDDARSSLGQSWFEDTTATSRRPSPLFLLSTFSSPSRSQSENVTALRRPLAFLRCCRLFCSKGD